MTNDAFNNPSVAPLADAVARGDAPEIRRLVANIHPDTPGSDGSTLLIAAINQGNLASVQALLDSGADANRPGRDGETPVAAAAFAKDSALLQTVLAHGGNPNLQNSVTGAPPLTRAILGPGLANVKLLLDAGADPNLVDFNHDAPLHTAARTNAGAIILTLFQAGASPLAKNSSGATFQEYYFNFPRNILNERSLTERREIVAWLKTHHIPLQSMVQSDY